MILDHHDENYDELCEQAIMLAEDLRDYAKDEKALAAWAANVGAAETKGNEK